ncbi:ArsR family transcriptional regulator [Bacillus sp. JJ722]|uniref:ArsR family transcriptional regulator n=1 Tax=Bacillus sp. JJ722 TaxID=3122973 RepID=UPI002FFE6AC2
MKHLYSPQTIETISLNVETSIVWELIVGISGYTHTQLRHTFDFDEKWTAEKKLMPTSLINNLKVMEKTNLWYGLIMLQNKFSSTSVQDFSKCLLAISMDEFYEALLPYKNRDTEVIRIELAMEHHRKELFKNYAKNFESHDYLAAYVQNISDFSHDELCKLFYDTLDNWYKWVCQQKEWDKWNQALAFEQKQYRTLNVKNPVEEIEQITGGVKYLPEPYICTVKLIPQISYRPWTLSLRTSDTKLFFYPLKDDYLVEPGIPTKELIRGHKALGDELRLKLLYQLLKGPLSLQEMSIQLNTSKTTLHHQLSILKSAKFVQVDKGVYSANFVQISEFSESITKFLGVGI